MLFFTLSPRLRSFVLTLLMLCASVSSLEAKSTSGVRLKVTLQEVIILKTLLEQIELSTEEVSAFLAIQTPLEQLIAQQGEGARADQSLRLNLPAGSARDLLLFMERMSLRGGGAKQVNGIMKKVEKLLPKDSPLRDRTPASPAKVQFSLTPQEALLLVRQLQRIQVGAPELTAFLGLYAPLEKVLSKAQDARELSIKLPEQGPQNLLVFMQRFELVGSQAPLVQGLIERLNQLLEA